MPHITSSSTRRRAVHRYARRSSVIPWWSRISRRGPELVGAGYLLDTLGGIVGGLLFCFCLVHFLAPFQIGPAARATDAAQQLAAASVRLLELDPAARRDLGAAGRRWVAERFTEAAEVESYLDLYAELDKARSAT